MRAQRRLCMATGGHFRSRLLIGLGAVECRFDKIDTRDEIVARVEEAMKHVDPERLSISPDCGFSPGLDGVTCRWRSPIRSSRTRRPRRGG